MRLDSYWEDEDSASVSVLQNRARVTAHRAGKKVRVRFATCRHDECESVDVSFDECFTCAEWEEFLCELGRVCWGDPCDCHGIDDCECDDDDEREPVRVTVAEIREVIKGLHADDIVVFGDEVDED